MKPVSKDKPMDIHSHFYLALLLLVLPFGGKTQSIELMPSTEYVFADVQFLKPFDQGYRFTLFSRTRIQVEYNNQVDFFSGAYFNFTQKNGLGTTLLARTSNGGAGGDIGIHYNKNTATWSFFGLLGKSLSESKDYSWFSIFRYQPPLNEKWKSYTSLELFTVMTGGNHTASIQRLRLGVERDGYQFGLGLNWLELGNSFVFLNDSYGFFIRKVFK